MSNEKIDGATKLRVQLKEKSVCSWGGVLPKLRDDFAAMGFSSVETPDNMARHARAAWGGARNRARTY